MGGREGRPRVLIVDDDEDMNQLVAEVLHERGIEAVCCLRGEDAMSAVAEADAVVTDVNLDGESGLELCARILVAHPGLPIVVVSGDATSRAAALRRGAAQFLVKPIDITDLARVLRELVAARV
jgi:DNA-binding NtrC family response regulator